MFVVSIVSIVIVNTACILCTVSVSKYCEYHNSIVSVSSTILIFNC